MTPAIKRRAEKGKQLNLSMTVDDTSGALNPDWVELLMGFPLGWTEIGSKESQESLEKYQTDHPDFNASATQ